MADDNESIPSAADAFAEADLGRDLRVTPTISDTAAEAPPDLDAGQAVWSAELHESPPSKNAQGLWRRKRGNGARKAKGQPVVTPTITQSTVEVERAPEAKPEADEAEGGAVEAVNLGPVDYAATGEGITRGLFALLRLVFGPAWEQTPDERRAWSDCLSRMWATYQWPRLGAFAELCFLATGAAAKRSGDEQTKSVARRIWDFCMGRKAVEAPRAQSGPG